MSTATIVAFLLSLVFQVGYPLFVTLLYRRRTGARWQAFAYGGLVFAVFQLFTWLPLSAYLDVVLGNRLSSPFWAFVWLLAMALMTALFEEGGRWLGFRYLFPRAKLRLGWRQGVMYGLGHGFLETVLFIAGLTFVYLLAYVALTKLGLAEAMPSLSENAPSSVRQAISDIVDTAWTQPMIVAVERMLALPHQVAWTLLVMQSHISRQKRWFGFAVLYHLSIAVIVPGLARLFGFFTAEGVNVLFALLSLWIVVKLRDTNREMVV